MSTETRPNLPPFIKDSLTRSLEIEYEAVAKEAVTKFEADIARRKSEVIAGVVLNVSQHMTMNDMKDRLVIEIIKVDNYEQVKLVRES